jgi:hypothetical protein
MYGLRTDLRTRATLGLKERRPAKHLGLGVRLQIQKIGYLAGDMPESCW